MFAWATIAHAEITVRWITPEGQSNKPVVVVSGLRPPAEKSLSVYADQGNLKADLSVPPMAGRYWQEKDDLHFEPRFPLERGVTYRAVCRPGGNAPAILAMFKLPLLRAEPTTAVIQIYPSAEVLPEN